MSKIITLTDLNNTKENKIKKTIMELSTQINTLKISKLKNKRYIEALEQQVRNLAVQLKDIKQEPKFDLTTILRDINNETMKERGLSKKEIEDIDNEIDQKIKSLMI